MLSVRHFSPDRVTQPPIWEWFSCMFNFFILALRPSLWRKHFLQRKINDKIWTKLPFNQIILLCSLKYIFLDWFITTCIDKRRISGKACCEKLLPRLVDESPDRAVDRLNYTLDWGIFPKSRGSHSIGK